MKVGILGSGDVAKMLASGFAKHGHQVLAGKRPTWGKPNPLAPSNPFVCSGVSRAFYGMTGSMHSSFCRRAGFAQPVSTPRE